ncbi:hypothetical protein [Sphaerisporangium aureirubrum]|uniref:Uncharacterized protein n=1 Tax=Sphaerisporangium aureirubrum TaxID=1544736 RepID=A0ABW1NDG2_9ACTN
MIPHTACDNCDGIDPATCLNAPPAERAEESDDEFRARLATALSHSFGPTRGMADHLDAVLAVVRPELDRLREERDQAIAHDRQPYPTQWAYDQACAALWRHRGRADRAQAVCDLLSDIIAGLNEHAARILGKFERSLRNALADPPAAHAEHGPCDGDPIECTAEATQGQAEEVARQQLIKQLEETRRERDLLRGALVRVVTLAKTMRTWASPYGMALDYSDYVAEAVLGSPDPHRAGEALAKFEGELAAALQAVDDQWRQAAGDYSDRLVRAYQLLAEILREFTHKGHPGYAALQTGWIEADRFDTWRATHRALLTNPATEVAPTDGMRCVSPGPTSDTTATKDPDRRD